MCFICFYKEIYGILKDVLINMSDEDTTHIIKKNKKNMWRALTIGNAHEQTVSSRDDVHLILKSGPKKPKLQDVDQTMYMVASSRILANLLQSGKISHSQTSHYLAYMVKIGMLAQRYQWSSVLLYDREYRKL